MKRGKAIMKIRTAISTLLSIVLTAGLCSGQQSQGISDQLKKLPTRSVPSLLLSQLNALGNRMKAKGKELTVYTGIFIDEKGNQIVARVIHQLPNLVRLEGFKGKDTALSFDGERGNGISSQKKDESLLELFVMDFAEGMLASVQESAAVRFIGGGFGPDPKTNPDYTGPRYDIYEITAPIKGQEKETIRTKEFFFDSQTKLLSSVRYDDYSNSPPIRIETRFSYWGNQEESSYPAQVERYENGKRIFAFIAESIESGASKNTEFFK
jgi:hypothetical protein